LVLAVLPLFLRESLPSSWTLASSCFCSWFTLDWVPGVVYFHYLAEIHYAVATREFRFLESTLLCSKNSGLCLFGSLADGTYTHISDIDIVMIGKGYMSNRAANLREHAKKFDSIKLNPMSSCSSNMVTGTSNGIKFNIVLCSNFNEQDKITNEIKRVISHSKTYVSVIRILKWFASLYMSIEIIIQKENDHLYQAPSCTHCQCTKLLPRKIVHKQSH